MFPCPRTSVPPARRPNHLLSQNRSPILSPTLVQILGCLVKIQVEEQMCRSVNNFRTSVYASPLVIFPNRWASEVYFFGSKNNLPSPLSAKSASPPCQDYRRARGFPARPLVDLGDVRDLGSEFDRWPLRISEMIIGEHNSLSTIRMVKHVHHVVAVKIVFRP